MTVSHHPLRVTGNGRRKPIAKLDHDAIDYRARSQLWRKRSFGSQSDRGERFAERVMTVAHTARKQGKDVLDFIVRSLTACIRGTTPPSLFAATTG